MSAEFPRHQWVRRNIAVHSQSAELYPLPYYAKSSNQGSQTECQLGSYQDCNVLLLL
jgi:hypothetical protein